MTINLDNSPGRYILLFILSLTFLVDSGQLYAQNNSIREKAALFLSNEEYEMAIPVLSYLIEEYPFEANLYIDRGDSYSRTGNSEEAVKDYKKALSLSPENADLIFKLANAYDRQEDLVNAIAFFRLLSQKDQYNASPLHRLAFLYLDTPDPGDSALYFAQKALETEPENPVSYYALSMVYLRDSEYAPALDAATKGLELNPSNVHLNMSQGLAYFFQKNFKKSHLSFSRASDIEIRSDILYYKALSLLLSNTPPQDFYFDKENKIHLVLDGSVKAKGHSFKALKEKSITDFSQDEKLFTDSLFSMGLRDFYDFYTGYAFQRNYWPKETDMDTLKLLLKQRRYDELKRKASLEADARPANFPVYYLLSIVSEEESENEHQFSSIFKYYGFLNAILASGSGTDKENAFLVIDRSHELEITANMGIEVLSHATLVRKGIHYDILTAKNGSGKVFELWFNVESNYQNLQNLYNQRIEKLRNN